MYLSIKILCILFFIRIYESVYYVIDEHVLYISSAFFFPHALPLFLILCLQNFNKT